MDVSPVVLGLESNPRVLGIFINLLLVADHSRPAFLADDDEYSIILLLHQRLQRTQPLLANLLGELHKTYFRQGVIYTSPEMQQYYPRAAQALSLLPAAKGKDQTDVLLGTILGYGCPRPLGEVPLTERTIYTFEYNTDPRERQDYEEIALLDNPRRPKVNLFSFVCTENTIEQPSAERINHTFEKFELPGQLNLVVHVEYPYNAMYWKRKHRREYFPHLAKHYPSNVVGLILGYLV